MNIIGTVAAMTLPTVISVQRKAIVEARLAKFYSSYNQAIKLAEVQYGDKRDWYRAEANDQESMKEFFLKYIAPHLNYDSIKYVNNAYFITLNDGSGFYYTWYANDIHFFPDSKKRFRDDVSTITVVEGKDVFMFGCYPYRCLDNGYSGAQIDVYCGKGLEMYVHADSYDGTRESIKNNIRPGRLIELNGWKVPEDYPIKF